MKKTNVAVLGSTGSIGRNAVKVLKMFPDRFRVTGLAARSSVSLLAEQANELRPGKTVTTDPAQFGALRAKVDAELKCAAGDEQLVELATAPETDIVLCAIVGTTGLEPVLAALRAGKRVALASKEVLVMAGELVRAELARSPQSELLPVDSEHSAIFQCLAGRDKAELRHLLLTASGGAFRDWTRDEMEHATLQDALAHPTWNMGPKVTIDSASLMNKALEMVEARYLFDVAPEQIKVLLHPQSIIHSMVELCDGSLIAQLSRPDMRFAIQYALTWPERLPGNLPELDFASRLQLDLQQPEPGKYPALEFAYEAMRRGGTLPAVMNAANEIAVEQFRRGRIRFTGIWKIVERTMAAHTVQPQSDLVTLRNADAWAREFAAALPAHP